MPDKSSNEKLKALFEELKTKYQNGLDEDLEFAKLKVIYLELKDIVLKLKNLRKINQNFNL